MIKLPSRSFLQTHEWEEFQQRLGRKTTRIDQQLLIEHQTLLGNYWYGPRITINRSFTPKVLDHLEKTKSMFLKIDPNWDSQIGEERELSIKKVAATQPQDTLVLELDKEETLLQSFHPKTRYNIQLAQKKSIRVIHSTDRKGAAVFNQLARSTAARQQIRFHPAQYYQTMIATLGGKPTKDKVTTSIVVAYYQKEPIAANILLWHYPWVYYLHGASSYEHRSLMAPHLLQWQAMKIALEHDFKYYDFWGIAPIDSESKTFNPRHPWSGITRFKLGFGGQPIHFSDSFDVINLPFQYYSYKLLFNLKQYLTHR